MFIHKETNRKYSRIETNLGHTSKQGRLWFPNGNKVNLQSKLVYSPFHQQPSLRRCLPTPLVLTNAALLRYISAISVPSPSSQPKVTALDCLLILPGPLAVVPNELRFAAAGYLCTWNFFKQKSHGHAGTQAEAAPQIRIHQNGRISSSGQTNFILPVGSCSKAPVLRGAARQTHILKHNTRDLLAP